MDLLTILINGLGSGIAKGVLNVWLGDENVTKEIGKNIVSILASKANDTLASRIGARQFDEISEKVSQSLLSLFVSKI